MIFQLSPRQTCELVKAQLSSNGSSVLWQDDDSEVLVEVKTLEVEFRPGLLVFRLRLRTTEYGSQKLTIPFSVGKVLDDAHLMAVTEKSPRGDPHTILRWGSLLQDVLWNKLLYAGDAHRAVMKNGHGLQISGLYTDGKRLAFVALPPVSKKAVKSH